jgi:hypothetical protein
MFATENTSGKRMTKDEHVKTARAGVTHKNHIYNKVHYDSPRQCKDGLWLSASSVWRV